jgi:hypothetical protein
MADLFKIATKRKYRWNFKGCLSVEDLFDLKVEELDAIYKVLVKMKKATAEESLLNTVSKEDKVLENKIEIIKIIVNDKLVEAEKNRKIAEQRIKNQRILEIMADKEDAALKDKSIDELKAMLVVDEMDDED